MLSEKNSSSSQSADDRESRVQQLVERLRTGSEDTLRQMAELLVDLPEEKSFGQIEYDLRDLAHQLASSVHQTGLEAGKKRATAVPPLSAPPASTMPASLDTATKPG